jgi:hypothetical protein
MLELAYWARLCIAGPGRCYICLTPLRVESLYLFVEDIRRYQKGLSKCDPRRCEGCCEFY